MTKKVVKKAKITVKKTPKTKVDIFDVIIIGGGPAGLMAACSAACLRMQGESKQKVLVLEKNDELGKKLLISGGGRCNITNANPNHREFVSKFGKKGDFLYSPLSIFGVPETIKFFNDLGLETKVEAGFRVFPESDNSADVLDILVNQAKKLGVEFKLGAEVEKLNKKAKQITSVSLKSGEKLVAHKFILTTGGMSHPETGSTGDGFEWLKEIGHKVAAANPSLVPIKVSNAWVGGLAGLTLDNIGISVWAAVNNIYKKILSKKGRVLFTHNGLSGPTILNMSKVVGEYVANGDVLISLDFFPGVGLDQMHKMMLDIFQNNLNKKIKNLTFREVPAKIFELMLSQLEIDPDWEINEIRKEERIALVEKFKKFEMKVAGLMGFDQAIISSGGLDLNEVNFKTMGSKLYDNLYFAGDILDFDRPSGGFSLQLCWTTGYIAGKN